MDDNEPNFFPARQAFSAGDHNRDENMGAWQIDKLQYSRVFAEMIFPMPNARMNISHSELGGGLDHEYKATPRSEKEELKETRQERLLEDM